MTYKGWQGAIRIATTEEGLATAANIPKVQNVSVTHGPSLEALYEIGSRLPTQIKEGNVEISLTIEKHYEDNTFANYAGVSSAGEHTEYWVGIYPGGYSAGKPKIVLRGKFSNWSLSISQDGIVTESVEFVGKAISVGTI